MKTKEGTLKYHHRQARPTMIPKKSLGEGGGGDQALWQAVWEASRQRGVTAHQAPDTAY